MNQTLRDRAFDELGGGELGNRRAPARGRGYVPFPEVLDDALTVASSLGSGEVHIETEAGSGAIYVSRGAVAWVARSSRGATLSLLLQRRGLATRSVLRAVFRDCVRDGTNFAEILIATGTVPRDVMRSTLLEHNASELLGLIRSRIRTVRTVPRERRYSSDLLFAPDELIEASIRLTAAETTGSTPIQKPEFVGTSFRPPTIATQPKEESYNMADISKSLEEVMKIDGAIATALVDFESGLTLGTLRSGSFDIELAASGNTAVVRAKTNVMKSLGIRGPIEDILISLDTQYHLIRPLAKVPSLFLYLAIDRSRSNLGLARHRLKAIEEELNV